MRRNSRPALLAISLLLAIAIAAGIWWILNNNSPDTPTNHTAAANPASPGQHSAPTTARTQSSPRKPNNQAPHITAAPSETEGENATTKQTHPAHRLYVEFEIELRLGGQPLGGSVYQDLDAEIWSYTSLGAPPEWSYVSVLSDESRTASEQRRAAAPAHTPTADPDQEPNPDRDPDSGEAAPHPDPAIDAAYQALNTDFGITEEVELAAHRRADGSWVWKVRAEIGGQISSSQTPLNPPGPAQENPPRPFEPADAAALLARARGGSANVHAWFHRGFPASAVYWNPSPLVPTGVSERNGETFVTMAPIQIELIEEPKEGKGWVGHGRLVRPHDRMGVYENEIVIAVFTAEGPFVSSPIEWVRVAPDGSFMVGLEEVVDEATEKLIPIEELHWIVQYWREDRWLPFGTSPPRVRGRLLDFGEVEYPWSTITISVDRSPTAWPEGVPPRDAPVVCEIDCAFPVEGGSLAFAWRLRVLDEPVCVGLIDRYLKVEVIAEVEDNYSHFRFHAHRREGPTDAVPTHTSAVLRPAWQGGIEVRASVGGKLNDDAHFDWSEGRGDEAVMEQSLQHWMDSVASLRRNHGYSGGGTGVLRLPRAESAEVKGHWVAAWVYGYRPALKFVPADATQAVVIELTEKLPVLKLTVSFATLDPNAVIPAGERERIASVEYPFRLIANPGAAYHQWWDIALTRQLSLAPGSSVILEVPMDRAAVLSLAIQAQHSVVWPIAFPRRVLSERSLNRSSTGDLDLTMPEIPSPVVVSAYPDRNADGFRTGQLDWKTPEWLVEGRPRTVDLSLRHGCGGELEEWGRDWGALPLLYGEGQVLLPIRYSFQGKKLVAELPGRIVIRLVRPAGAEVQDIWISVRSMGERKYEWHSHTTATNEDTVALYAAPGDAHLKVEAQYSPAPGTTMKGVIYDQEIKIPDGKTEVWITLPGPEQTAQPPQPTPPPPREPTDD